MLKKNLLSKLFNVCVCRSIPRRAIWFDEVVKPGSPVLPPPKFPHYEVEQREFVDRRHKVMEDILLCSPETTNDDETQNHIVVLPSLGIKNSSNNDSDDLTYLTGIETKNACLVMVSIKNGDAKSILFFDENLCASNFIARSKSIDEIIQPLEIDEAYPIDQMSAYLNGLFKSGLLFTVWCDNKSASKEMNAILEKLENSPSVSSVKSPAPSILKTKLIKSTPEIRQIRKICHIITEAINKGIATSAKGASVKKIRRNILNKCEDRNIGESFVVINAPAEQPRLRAGDVLMVEAGIEHNGGFISISRTWPVGGVFLPVQQLLYKTVYNIQQNIIQCLENKECKTLDELYAKVDLMFGSELKEITCMKSASANELSLMLPSIYKNPNINFIDVESTNYTPFFKNVPIVPGMIIAIQAGLNIPQNRKEVRSSFRGLSVQIRDNILIKNNGIEVLSENCISEPSQIEKMASLECPNKTKYYFR